ncbi:MAG: glycosyltransferase family 4 protein [Bacteroidales bacterium]
MKVLMFGWEFPPHITGGLGTACFGLCKGLGAQGVDVIFTAPKLYGDEDQRVARMVNATDIEIDLRHKIYMDHWKHLTYIEIGARLIPYMGLDEYLDIEKYSHLDGTSIDEKYAKRKFVFSGKYQQNLLDEVYQYSLVAATIATQHEFDVIHAHDWLTYQAGIAAKKATGKPLVIHVHATEFDRSGENINKTVFDIERAGMLAADQIICVSNLTRQIVIQRYGINPDKCFTVYNAVEPTDVPLDDSTVAKTVKEKIVTFLGRVTYQKGPEYFVEAAYRILQKDPNVRFVMAGDGDMLPKIVQRVAQLRMGTKFHFTGFLKGLEVDKMFLLSDVYVMPSVSEPFGISPLEAMRSNVPVVISKQSGCSEILNHALKVDFWDVDAMADAIYGLLHYDALARTFRKYGADEVNSLKWENSARKVLEVYNRAVNRN